MPIMPRSLVGHRYEQCGRADGHAASADRFPGRRFVPPTARPLCHLLTSLTSTLLATSLVGAVDNIAVLQLRLSAAVRCPGAAAQASQKTNTSLSWWRDT